EGPRAGADLGRAAADIHDHEPARRARAEVVPGARPDEPRLLVAGDDLGLEPRLGAGALEERGAVRRVARRAGRDARDPLRAERARLAGEAREDAHGVVDRGG